MTDRRSSLNIQTPSDQRTIETTAADLGVPLTQVFRHHGLPLNARCGDRGLCEGCLVTLVDGVVEDAENGQAREATGDQIQACRFRLITGRDIALRVPEQSLTRFAAHTVDDFTIELPHAHDPLWRRGRTPPLEPREGPPVGVAIDVGTTTVALMLVDLTDGEVLTRAGAFNRQVDHGDNVLTRINLCSVDPTSVSMLRDAVVNQTLAVVLEEAMQRAGVEREQLVCFTAAGNPTMLHLLAGENPGSMGVFPFTPVFLEHRQMAVSTIGLRWPDEDHAAYNGRAERTPTIHLLPSAAAYIGSDITAGVVASGMRYRRETCLLIDVGTNGEIVLNHDGRLMGCATAAGPAFEGGGLTDGVRAGDGAISHLSIQHDPFHMATQVIGDSKPVGLCGSAYIDLLTEGLHSGLLGPTGRFDTDRVPDSILLPADTETMKGIGIVVAKGQGKRPVVVHESDIASLLQAKAAIAAGILTLLDVAGLTPNDIDTVFLAGGFGRHVNVKHAIACGLLPGFSPDRVELMGNLSLAGAYLALLDRSLLDEMAEAAHAIEIVELNDQPGFEERFIDQLMLASMPAA